MKRLAERKLGRLILAAGIVGGLVLGIAGPANASTIAHWPGMCRDFKN
ncbi:MAG: hypothetical protein FWD83_08340 [Promicromonosporaceae bacterium]|nr:hypothetical protein [Promicromonosporaceae bacterium]